MLGTPTITSRDLGHTKDGSAHLVRQVATASSRSRCCSSHMAA